MNLCVQFLIVIIIIIYVIYLSRYGTVIEENFDSNPEPGPILEADPNGMETKPILPGHGLRHPEKDIVSSTINDYLGNPENAGPIYSDPATIVKLKRTIRADNSRENQAKLAYNDVAAYRPGGIHPFNISASIISQTQSESPVYNADIFDNSYYSLWESDQDKELSVITKRADDIVKTGANCIDFKNVNQCMSVCSNSPNCVGFYIDEPGVRGATGARPGKCCMMVNPPYAANRHSYDRLPNDLDTHSLRTINKLIERDRETSGKLVFDYIRTDSQNGTYKTDITREQCRNICPKCIMGRCPENYRCTNMNADPRYNFTCLITNEDRYNENKPGYQFDSPAVPYLDVKYQLNEYAGFNSNTEYPILRIPESERYYLADRILPTHDELQSAFTSYDENHVGPLTYHASFNRDFNVQQESMNPDQIGIRGGNDPIGITSNFRRGPYYSTNRTVPNVKSNSVKYRT